jgi:hypothetical protein
LETWVHGLGFGSKYVNPKQNQVHTRVGWFFKSLSSHQFEFFKCYKIQEPPNLDSLEKSKLEKGPGIAIIQKLKKSKDFHERVDKRTDDLLANYLIFYTF